jgi:predicted small lipoprotein YifL
MLTGWPGLVGQGIDFPTEEAFMRQVIKVSAVVLALAFLVACGARQRGPAEEAIKAADAAWAAVSAEATRYVPDQAKGIEDAIAGAKNAFERGAYAGVIADAGAIPGKIAELQKVIDEKKSEWTAAWRTLDSALGSGMTAVQTKVDELMGGKKLPAGVNKADVEGAQTALAAMQQTYAEAKTAYGDGDYQGALAKANQVQAELGKIMTGLKLEMPVAEGAGKALTDAATKTIEGALKK